MVRNRELVEIAPGVSIESGVIIDWKKFGREFGKQASDRQADFIMGFVEQLNEYPLRERDSQIDWIGMVLRQDPQKADQIAVVLRTLVKAALR